jgi:hypothetical protein
VGKPRYAGFPWSEPRKAASPTHPFQRGCEVMSASLALSRHSRTPATLPYGKKKIGKLKGPERRRIKQCASPLIRKCKRTGGCRSRSGAASAPVATQAVPTITHEYSLTLGRSSACTNSRRAPCRTLCDETQSPFERALPSPGMLQFVEHEYSLTLGRTSASTNSRRAPCSPKYACYLKHNIIIFKIISNYFIIFFIHALYD